MADPQFCLLAIDHWSTCLTKAEWSGWMQAIGSTLALAIALAVPYWQDHVQRQDGSRFARDIGDLNLLVMETLLKHTDFNMNAVLSTQTSVDTLLGRAASIPSHLLSRRESLYVHNVIAQAKSIQINLADLIKHNGARWVPFREVLERQVQQAKAARDVLSGA
jgi:hypothetical protein